MTIAPFFQLKFPVFRSSPSKLSSLTEKKEKNMARRKLLLLLKPFDVYHVTQSKPVSHFTNPRVFHYLDNRRKVHKEAINFCQQILQKKAVDWKPILRNNLSQPIHNVDLVVTVGGDGTLLQASHFMDDSIPVLGVNSDPTQAEEVLDSFLEGQTVPSKLSRMSISVNSKSLSTYALNDILIAHPCPATVSRFSLRIERDDQTCLSLVNCRSSGLRVSTAAGSTAAMLSAGGFAMPMLSRDLQYMVREPISPGAAISSLMHGLIKSDQSMNVTWFSKEGLIYVDGSHVFYTIQNGDSIEISSKAPVLQVVFPHLSS
ncbi:NADH kinase isoform X2 [Durio zibethinus]|uniref:NADH kinase isoform X2 n=1 Tax=Durio zibethinus TaxID=66656 RepID=A0A6P5Y4L0_DURZI|nr:NADH kinase isoform X2 [Durio zibethinus]